MSLKVGEEGKHALWECNKDSVCEHEIILPTVDQN